VQVPGKYISKRLIASVRMKGRLDARKLAGAVAVATVEDFAFEDDYRLAPAVCCDIACKGCGTAPK
jgi:hypothetical protein